MDSKLNIIVIGAGFTGCAIAHDLALRGLPAIIFDRGEIASGTSGRTHGLLHSGARYCVGDREAAIECYEENIILRNITPQCIEFNGGFFAAFDNTDIDFAPAFVAGAEACGIPIERFEAADLLKVEPSLSPSVLGGYSVPDGSFDPLRLALAFAASAKANGATFKPYHEVEAILTQNGRVTALRVWDRTTNSHFEQPCDLLINATGAWAGIVAQQAKLDVPVIPTPGIMVAFEDRPVNHVINRLNKPGDGDIIIPQRRMAVIGTTSFEVKDVDYIPVDEQQLAQMVDCAVAMVPRLESAPRRGVYMSARPLIGSLAAGRSLSRTFKCYDHTLDSGVEGMITITGGKATTCRVMAEKTVDVACAKLGITAASRTKEVPLLSYRDYYKDQQTRS